ncbi:MAG: hypothetical protein ACRDZZ_07030 [Ilumatobacteraceae bacterium]
MSDRHELVRVSRRAALGAVAAAGAALGGAANALAAPGPVDPGGPIDDPYFVADGFDVVEIAPAPTTPGTRYVSLAGIDFKPTVHVEGYDSDFGELFTENTAGFTAPVPLPHGARITEMVAYATRPTSPSTVVRLVCHRSSVASASSFVVVAQLSTGSLAASPLVQMHKVTVPSGANGAVVDEDAAAYFVLVNPPGDLSHLLWGVRIGYVTADAGRFFPIDPIRAYDSRAALPQPGLLGPNSNRAILTKDSRANGSGAVVAADVVPAGASAIACNLTITGTTGPNFIALTPGDAASFTASAINWTGPDQSVANGLIAKLDANRFVKVWCGDQTGATHVILDVNGYWL